MSSFTVDVAYRLTILLKWDTVKYACVQVIRTLVSQI